MDGGMIGRGEGSGAKWREKDGRRGRRRGMEGEGRGLVGGELDVGRRRREEEEEEES